MQRLFSTFANGWPGLGLLLQRFLTATVVIYSAVVVKGQPQPGSVIPHMLAALAALLLLAGFWTPVAGTLIAIAEIWIALCCANDPLIPIMLATLGATLALLGPGAWSIDARLFGRKHIDTFRR